MKVDYESAIINKPVGKRTPARTIPFNKLHRYIEVFKEVVDVRTPSEAVTSWVDSCYDDQQVIQVLKTIVVRFGGGHRIWGKYPELWEASPQDINEILSEVHRRRGDDAGKLRAILRGIKGLGGLPYSTKILRFLSPTHVILDSILREEYGLTEADYDEFADHCCRIGEILGVIPMDVESGLFAYVQLANPNQRSRYWKPYQYLVVQSDAR